MERCTKWNEAMQQYGLLRRDLELENGWYSGDAVQRLARFENLFEQIQREHSQVCQQMEQLKQIGQGRSASFKQLMARKLSLEDMLSYFRIYVGLK